MDRSSQIAYCKVCKHKQFDFHQGIICQLTGEKASFEISCQDFSSLIDDTIPEVHQTIITATPLELSIDRGEKLTNEDFFLLATGSLLATFVLRTIVYSGLSNQERFFSFSSILSLAIIQVASLFFRKREKEIGSLKPLGDWQFKLIFSLFFAWINCIYRSVTEMDVSLLIPMLIAYFAYSFFLFMVVSLPVVSIYNVLRKKNN